ncbi:PfkB family carbohydrate kinase [Streptomyces sp. NRRL S-350]|uniref:PfkB family carbohydrate kinase n=1 Tax=Streptomyces sp. NRRL S-350 TaxID=1463902 RepID=UPI0004BF2D60|nr:PfkB family carbohydrate kinase [Streptomyces sp. NRRL S-350]
MGEATHLVAKVGGDAEGEATLAELPAAEVVTEDRPIRLPAPAVRVVATTGAGAVFSGALAAGLARGAGLPTAATTAVAPGAFAVTALGARGALPAPPTPDRRPPTARTTAPNTPNTPNTRPRNNTRRRRPPKRAPPTCGPVRARYGRPMYVG